MTSTILVASDGTPGALGALRMAASLQERDGARVEVMGVVEPIPAFDVGMMITIPRERPGRGQTGGIGAGDPGNR